MAPVYESQYHSEQFEHGLDISELNQGFKNSNVFGTNMNSGNRNNVNRMNPEPRGTSEQNIYGSCNSRVEKDILQHFLEERPLFCDDINIPIMENFVQEQYENDYVNLVLNIYLLRQYIANKSYEKVEYVRKILILSLFKSFCYPKCYNVKNEESPEFAISSVASHTLNLYTTNRDFEILLLILPTHWIENDKFICNVCNIFSSLKRCRFTLTWKYLEGYSNPSIDEYVLHGATGSEWVLDEELQEINMDIISKSYFLDILQNYIIGSIKKTFYIIPVHLFSKFINAPPSVETNHSYLCHIIQKYNLTIQYIGNDDKEIVSGSQMPALISPDMSIVVPL